MYSKDITYDRTPPITFLCFDLTNLTPLLRFVICSGIVFLFFLSYGFIQEKLFTIDGFQPFGWYLTCFQFILYSIFGCIDLRIRQIPIAIGATTRAYTFLAVVTVGSMAFSNASVGYLNYPTQVIFKCCKLIPVLVGGIIIQGKRYGFVDFLSASIMCIGLILFTLADSRLQPHFNIKGVVLISVALLCDSMIGNIQEKAMKTYGATNVEIAFYSYFIGLLFLILPLVFTGDIYYGFVYFAEDPLTRYGWGAAFAIAGYLGTQAVLTLVRTCGAFEAVTVTTCRKAVTILLSFVFFTKPFTIQYLWSGLLVVMGIYLNLYNKKRPTSFRDVLHWLKYERLYKRLDNTKKYPMNIV